jgi:hypothetical protein
MSVELLNDLKVRISKPLTELTLEASLLLAVVIADPALIRRLIVLRFAVPFAT